MLNVDKGKGRFYLVCLIVISFAAAFVLTGCKEKSKEGAVSTNSGTQEQQNQRTSQQNTQKSENNTRSETVVLDQGSVGSKALDDIITGAQSWEAVYRSWYGKPAPDFTAIDLDGNKHNLSDYKGKKVLLVFWATWCPPCRAEVPDLKELHTKIKDKDMIVLAIGSKEEGIDKIKPFAEAMEITYTVLVEEGDLPEPFGVDRLYRSTGIPGAFYIDAKGLISLGTAGIVPLSDCEAILNAI